VAQIADAPSPRRWYYGWNIVAACILSQVAANGLTFNAMSLFLRDWSVQLHTPISRLQLALAGIALVSAMLAPLVGVLADKYPARRLFACGLLGIAIFYVAIGSVTAAWQIMALYGLLAPAALTLCTAVPANTLISRWFVRRLGLALGLSAFGIGMAGVVLPPVIAVILPVVGWRMIWRGGGLLIVLIVIPLVMLVIHDRPTHSQGFSYLSDDGKPHQSHGHGSGIGRQGWRAIVARKTFWLLVAIYLPMLALYAGSSQNIAPLAASHGLSQRSAGVLISVLSLSHVVSTPICGLMSDRLGNRLPFASLAVTMTVGAAVFAFGASLISLAVGCMLIGFGGGLFTLLAAAIGTEFGREEFGRAFGLSMFFLPIASLAPFFVAKTQETAGSYTPGLVGLTVFVLISGALSLTLSERSRG
jgi:MFS family permease